jgi:hypothetical protein
MDDLSSRSVPDERPSLSLLDSAVEMNDVPGKDETAGTTLERSIRPYSRRSGQHGPPPELGHGSFNQQLYALHPNELARRRDKAALDPIEEPSRRCDAKTVLA